MKEKTRDNNLNYFSLQLSFNQSQRLISDFVDKNPPLMKNAIESF